VKFLISKLNFESEIFNFEIEFLEFRKWNFWNSKVNFLNFESEIFNLEIEIFELRKLNLDFQTKIYFKFQKINLEFRKLKNEECSLITI